MGLRAEGKVGERFLRQINAQRLGEHLPRFLLFALNPNMGLARLVARLDVDDTRAAADGAVFGVRLAFAAAQIDGKLIGLPTKRAFYGGGRSRASTLGHAATMPRSASYDACDVARPWTSTGRA